MFIIEDHSLTRAHPDSAQKHQFSSFHRFHSARKWTLYGAASIVYFLATVDATFIRKYELDVTEVGTEVDLVLSFVAVVATEAWTVFV